MIDEHLRVLHGIAFSVLIRQQSGQFVNPSPIGTCRLSHGGGFISN